MGVSQVSLAGLVGFRVGYDKLRPFNNLDRFAPSSASAQCCDTQMGALTKTLVLFFLDP